MKTASIVFILLSFVFVSFVQSNASINPDKAQTLVSNHESSDSMFFPVLGTLHSGDYEKSTVESQDEFRVLVQCQMGYCNTDFHVVSYETLLLPKGGEPKFFAVTGNSFAQIKKYVKIADSENKLIIANITIENSDGDQVKLPRNLIIDFK